MLAMAGVDFKLASCVRRWDGGEGFVSRQNPAVCLHNTETKVSPARVGGICIISLCLPAGSPPPHTHLLFLYFILFPQQIMPSHHILPASLVSSTFLPLRHYSEFRFSCLPLWPFLLISFLPGRVCIFFIASVFCEQIKHIFCCATCHCDHHASL